MRDIALHNQVVEQFRPLREGVTQAVSKSLALAASERAAGSPEEIKAYDQAMIEARRGAADAVQRALWPVLVRKLEIGELAEAERAEGVAEAHRNAKPHPTWAAHQGPGF